METKKDEAVAGPSGVTSAQQEQEMTYEQKVANASVIAKPMASKKLTKKCYKLIKKASKHADYVRFGLTKVQKRLNQGERGIVIFAGDIQQLNSMVHLPAVCEDYNIPYCFIPSRDDLGAALGIKRGTSMVLIKEKEDYRDRYNKIQARISKLPVKR